ncbi:MAG: hypothetical protein IJR80_07230 [Treponema sp.]|nr:hypothetical protein [Treponema sp.]
MKTNYWKSENNLYKFNNIPNDIELSNIGSSHTVYAMKYDFVPEIKTFNFGLAAQPYFYDYQLLNKFKNHLIKQAVILIPISYFGITQEEQYSLFRKRYYRILTRSEMDYYSFKEYLLYSKYPILSAGMNKTRLFRDIKQEQMSPFYNRTTSLNGHELYDYCLQKHNDWTTKDNGKTGYEHNILAVSKIIDLCYSNSFIPVLITTPITDVLNDIYEEDGDFFPTFEQFTTDLCNKYPDLLYLDYSRSEEFSHNHELFADGDHLNNFGAEKFTQTVVNELRSRGLLKN